MSQQLIANDSSIRKLTHSQLSHVASDAAVELDCHIRGKGFGFTSVEKLAEYLESEIEGIDQPSNLSSLLNPSVAVVMGRALDNANWAHDVKTVDQLVQQAAVVSKSLHRMGETGADTLPKLRAFCVELSKAAAEQCHSLVDSLPHHPFRR